MRIVLQPSGWHNNRNFRAISIFDVPVFNRRFRTPSHPSPFPMPPPGAIANPIFLRALYSSALQYTWKEPGTANIRAIRPCPNGIAQTSTLLNAPCSA